MYNKISPADVAEMEDTSRRMKVRGNVADALVAYKIQLYVLYLQQQVTVNSPATSSASTAWSIHLIGHDIVP